MRTRKKSFRFIKQIIFFCMSVSLLLMHALTATAADGDPPSNVATIQLEAEQAELSGGVKVNTNHPGYTGSGFLDGFWNYEGTATFTVNVPSSGDYNVTARYGSAVHDPATMSLIVNGTKVKQTSFPILENWSTWGTQTETVTLNAGVNTIAYKYDNGDTGVINLDHIRVSPAPIEAETATLLGFASVYNDSSASGGQAVEYLHVEGNGIEFNNVPAANSLTVRYAAPNSGKYSMYVNGVKTKTINFTGNGTWNGAYTSVTVPVDIPEGATLKLQHDAGDTGWNVDYIILAQGDQLFRAEEDFVKPIGRTVFHDDTLWLAQSGSGAEFEFRGKKAEITLKGDHVALGQTNHARIGIYVNGERVIDDVLNEPLKTYTVFESDSDEDVVIQIVKLSEAAMSTAGIHEIRVNAVDGIQPTQGSVRKIEFIGDSITAGYGVDDEETFSTATEDVTKTYAYKTAAALQADYSIVAYSGYGIVAENESSMLPLYYDIIAKSFGRIDGNLDVNNSPWDFNKFVPDLIVINLGTNDYSYTGDDPVKQAEYRDAYVEFLKQVRSHNADAHLMCTLGIMGDRLFPMVEQAAAAYSNETGDTNISVMKFDVQSAEDGFGAHWHPSETTHSKAADKLIDNIKEVMNW
ncbi:SGNH/GDSL hydrolase family protein [Halalkalibacterium halodurans]|uniref:SGNH/GDSL hydrolase family protein n=1 Tax=Halalkalibacterium halodurans TaxID=86665 RepID=UPI002AA9C8AF|nr:CBM35 domain-containing protein [Halalkalibacterium halodurans]MDY7221499.1 CBM35 domain-containing protein [Halalkalibacterium halodurans]MDY7240775.1 CBM35 domain-containing protein [Halalkalibacterium halodurans]MED4172239.1 CBM35 domain-containing protein [Halalkalibacterium halodurans]